MILSSDCCKLEHSHWIGIGGKLNFWILSFGKFLLEFLFNFQ